MMNYASYCAMCAEKNIINPYETEADFNRAYGICDVPAPLVVRPKHSHNLEVVASAANALRCRRTKAKEESKPKKPKAVKPPRIKKEKPPKEPKPRYRPQKIYTDEEIKERRAEARRKKRAEFVAQGLTIRGTERIIKEKKVLTPEELRERRLRYTRNWQIKNREKHLAYRREYRKRKAEEKLQSSGYVNSSSEPTSRVA